jgi:hypothetical protein
LNLARPPAFHQRFVNLDTLNRVIINITSRIKGFLMKLMKVKFTTLLCSRFNEDETGRVIPSCCSEEILRRWYLYRTCGVSVRSTRGFFRVSWKGAIYCKIERKGPERRISPALRSSRRSFSIALLNQQKSHCACV